ELDRLLAPRLFQPRAGEQAIERERGAADDVAVALFRFVFLAGFLLEAGLPVGHPRANLVGGDPGRRQLSVALEPRRGLGPVAQQEVGEGDAPCGVFAERALAESVQRRLQRGQALAEAPAVIVEPAGEVLR